MFRFMMALLAGFYRAFGLFQVSLVFLGSSLAYAENNPLPRFPVGDPRNCPLTNGVYRFEVLPGGGWDNLRNVHMGAVSVMNYSKCKTSDDGKYLIPDDVILYPIKESKVHVFAEMYDHWHNYSSTTTKSINAEGKFGFGSVSGSFSSEFESVKKHQVEDKAVTTRAQLRHVLYTAKLQPDAPLQAPFKSRLLEIASHLQLNNTAYANFLAQVLVRDFGTHYVTRVKAGAALAKVDHLTKKFVADFSEDKSKITAAASASFFGAFGATASYTQTTDKKVLDEYTQNIVYSTVYTFGGPPFRVNFTIDKWEDQLLDELVAVDQSGDPLHFAITPGSVPELSEELVFKLANVVEKAIKQYYEHNTIKGCTKMDSPNFSFQANLDDGSCESPTNNYTFGGVYQTCQCEGSPSSNPCGSFLQKNPLTADYSCSNGYEPVMLHQGRTPESCHRECHGFFIFKSCDTHCGFASYDTYWCVAKGSVPRNTGYLFGGLYSNVLKNPVTQDHSCPVKFYALRFGATMQVCVSDDYELGFQQSVPFGGFFSCNTGNPLGVKKAADSAKGSNGLSGLALFVKQSGPSVWPKTCPIGYSQHLGAIEEDCEINFCVKSNIFNSQGFLIIKRPPYSNAPKIYKYTVPLLVVNNDTGHIWFKRSNSPHWVLATKSSVAEFVAETNLDGPAIIGMDPAHDKQNPAHGKEKSSSQSSRDAMGAGAAAGITFGVTALAGLLIAVMVIGWRRHKTIQRESSGLMEPLNPIGYGAVKEEGSPQV